MHGFWKNPLWGITVLLAFQWIGEALVRSTRLPIPGPVVGMALLFLALLWRGSTPIALQTSGNKLLSNLGLLFVPATVGALLRIGNYGSQMISFILIVILSTLATLAVSAHLLQWLNSRNPH